METVTLVRYANEGFRNYEQSHVRSVKSKIEGCYAFIETEEDSLLTYTPNYQEEYSLINRSQHKRQELSISEDTLVFVKNKRISESKESIFFNEEKDFVIIPEEPIEKEILIAGEAFPLSMDIYVKVPLSFAKKQLQTLHSHYQWIRERVPNPDNLTSNTKVIDYCECIIDCTDIHNEGEELSI
ncbi:hypothetical protein CVD28_03100 [Bacillus sp. M6-12]|uniref:hypothetical protein n=1 Tax=Bacillus sp. M6-12 TaxID=2054166 RepID=UPI000C76C1FB|nr:hypothetical protein [Bacillus sp. M6-12]PLS19417.1 hypothetical protein CVD28_03100 [Bacillus sp. M6-12]